MNKKTNHLEGETSPYLLEHVTNPVDWYPWNEKALQKAKKENKPIFLSVGYSACHWCLVMEKECFNDEEIAKGLNQYFVSIKVDREERPDIDDIYMTSLQTITGQGGWPMSLFLTPEGEPFFAGTYFPKFDTPQRPGFSTVINSLARAWQSNEKSLRMQGKSTIENLKKIMIQDLPESPLPPDILNWSLEIIDQEVDTSEGGFGKAPKFPGSLKLDLYSEYLHQGMDQRKSNRIAHHLDLTLTKMAQGGIYDHIGGGFHRYSTDDIWLVPHFEKMLYDNALLAKTYFEASQVTNHSFHLRIGKEICDYILTEMTHEQGGFFSTTCADTEGIEGKFFLWSKQEIEKALGKKEGDLFCEIFQIIDPHIPWEKISFTGGTPPHDWFYGKVPHLKKGLKEHLEEHNKSLDDFYLWRKKLFEIRKKRVAPLRDEKVLTSWNGLMSTSLAKAYRVTGEKKYLEAAVKNINFIWKSLQENGRLNSSWKDGTVKHQGTLEDYANVAMACLELQKVGAGPSFLERAKILTKSCLTYFSDQTKGGFFYTAHDSENLIIRSKNPYDNSVPGGNGQLAGVLTRLGHLLRRSDYLKKAKAIFQEFSSPIVQSPHGLPALIREYSLFDNGPIEVILINGDEELKILILQGLKPQEYFLTEQDANLPSLKDKISDEKNEPILYLCSQGICQNPIKGENKIREKWKKFRPRRE
ncbi:MAG: thioredoxin domain-containing protein [Bdellovibrionota bacterium]|nr:thioredoxin domain-containing protein [Bdellovibrionota bacterium]